MGKNLLLLTRHLVVPDMTGPMWINKNDEWLGNTQAITGAGTLFSPFTTTAVNALVARQPAQGIRIEINQPGYIFVTCDSLKPITGYYDCYNTYFEVWINGSTPTGWPCVSATTSSSFTNLSFSTSCVAGDTVAIAADFPTNLTNFKLWYQLTAT